MSDRTRTQYFDSRFVYIWKVVYIQKTKLPVAISNWRTAFSWTWFSYVLQELLPTVIIVLLDGQLLILRQLRCHVHVTEFFYAVEFNRAKKATLEESAWIGRLTFSSLSLFSFSELNKALDTNEINTTDEGFWFSFHENYKLGPKSSARNILLTIYHIHTYSFARIKLTSDERLADTSSLFQYDPPENQIWHTDDSYLSQN